MNEDKKEFVFPDVIADDELEMLRKEWALLGHRMVFDGNSMGVEQDWRIAQYERKGGQWCLEWTAPEPPESQFFGGTGGATCAPMPTGGIHLTGAPGMAGVNWKASRSLGKEGFPTSPSEGDAFMDRDTQKLYHYSCGQWVQMGGR